jgi:hypothetical protein
VGHNHRGHSRFAESAEVLSITVLTATSRLALTLLVALDASNCRTREPGAVAAPPPAAPKIKLDVFRVDMETGIQDETMQKTVLVHNEGALALEIGDITASRFCSATIEPKVIEPAGAGQLAVTCRSDLYGPMREGINIHSNDPKLPLVTLQIVAQVTPRLAFDVPSVELKMPFGEERSQDVGLVGTLIEKARIRSKGPAVPDVDVIPSSSQPDKVRSYRIHCRGRKPGVHSGNIIITTGLERPNEIAVPFACNVVGTLEVSPTNPYFNLKVSGEDAVRIKVRSSQPGFEVQSVRITEGPFAARFEHAEDDNTYQIHVTVLKDRIEDEARSATGTLLIISNDRTEPKKEVPLFGTGRVNKVPAPAGASPAD